MMVSTEHKPVPSLTKHSCQWILSHQVPSCFLVHPSLSSPHNPSSSQLPQWESWNFNPFQCKGMGQSSQDFLTIPGKTKTKEICSHFTQGCPMAQRSVPASVLPLFLLVIVQVPAGASLRPWGLQRASKVHIKSFTHSLTFLHPLQMGMFGLRLQVSVCLLKSCPVAFSLEGMYWTKIMCLVSFQMKTGRKHNTAIFTWM